MAIGINIKQLATFDVMYRMQNFNKRKKKANFFRLFFKSNKKWVDELGISVIRRKNNYQTIIDYNGNLIPVKKYFKKPICNEDIVNELLSDMFKINNKYHIISKSKINYKDFTFKEKINLLEFIYNNFKNSKIKFKDKEKKRIGTFLVTSMPTPYEFDDFKIKESSIYHMQSLLHTEIYLHSKEKIRVDIMFSCCKMINLSKLSVTSNAMVEIRDYFSKNLHKFVSINPVITIKKLSEVMENYSLKYNVLEIQRDDMRYIIKEFNKKFKGITL